MRILFLSLTILTLAISKPVFANHQNGHKELSADDMQKHSSLKNADHTITVAISGLVCDFCARALEKVFGKRQEVSGIEVNLDTKLVTIGLKKGADIEDSTITKLIMDAGYNVVNIHR